MDVAYITCLRLLGVISVAGLYSFPVPCSSLKASAGQLTALNQRTFWLVPKQIP